MSNNFWSELEKPFFILSPMEAVTDVIFRHVIARAAAPDIYFTEFTNTNSWCSPKGQHSTRGRLLFTPDEQPIVAHIWGDVPEYFAEMSRGMAKMGYAGIDINMGCPAPNVAPKGKGSGLINHPETAAAIIAACKESGLPVSVKTRLGYTHIDEFRTWIPHLLRQNIVNLTIHLRSRKEMSKVPAHYEVIDELVRMRDEIAPGTLLTINGDIRDRAHGLELIREHPGVDGIMIGRGAFHNPYCFGEVRKETAGSNKQDLLGLLGHHLDLFDTYSAETRRPYETLKRFFKIYVRDFDGASELRDQLMHTKNTDEARNLIGSY